MIQFIPQDLTAQLWEESEKIANYANLLYRYTTDACIRDIMIWFINIPTDSFRQLIGLLTFQEVIVLLNQDRIDEAKLFMTKYAKFSQLYRFDGPIESIKSGSLLSSGK